MERVECADGTVWTEVDILARQSGATWRAIADQARSVHPKLAEAMDEAENDVLAYMDFPAAHRVKLHSTNGLERLNKEVKRRADVVALAVAAYA